MAGMHCLRRALAALICLYFDRALRETHLNFHSTLIFMEKYLGLDDSSRVAATAEKHGS